MVFICYSKIDLDMVMPLYTELIDAGIETWIDIQNLLPGQNWKTTIKNAIKKSKLFIVILTNNSVDKRGFVQKEISLALDYQGYLLEEDVFIIPIRLETCIIPDRLAKYHCVNIFGRDDIYRFVSIVKTYLLSNEFDKMKEAIKKGVNIKNEGQNIYEARKSLSNMEG